MSIELPQRKSAQPTGSTSHTRNYSYFMDLLWLTISAEFRYAYNMIQLIWITLKLCTLLPLPINHVPACVPWWLFFARLFQNINSCGKAVKIPIEKTHVLILLLKNFYKVLGMAPYPSRNDSRYKNFRVIFMTLVTENCLTGIHVTWDKCFKSLKKLFSDYMTIM